MSRVHAAVVSLRVQGDQGPDPAAEGHGRAQVMAEVSARQAARSCRTHGRQPGVLARRLPARRFSAELLEELRNSPPRSSTRVRRRHVTIRHLYIERRMTPLNLYSSRPADAAARPCDARVRQRDQGAGRSQHLPGDMLYKNFGVTRLRPRGVLRLRRNRIHDRLQLPPRPPGAARRGRDVGRALVPRRAKRHVP